MGTEADKKFSWVIKNFSSLKSQYTRSEIFVIGDCKWYLSAYRMGTKNVTKYLCLFLKVADFETLPIGWKQHTKCRLTVVNQLSHKLSEHREQQSWLDKTDHRYVYPAMISLPKLNDKKGGFVVNDEVKIVVEVEVLEVIGESDVSVSVSEGSEEVTQPLKRKKLNDDGAVYMSCSLVDVNGFLVLPSQAESMKRIFEKHPDMALEFRAKNQRLRTSCINVLLNLIETLCQSLQAISIDDLSQAEKALTYLKSSGFKVNWLETKMEQVKKTKIEEQIGKTRMQDLEKELKVFKKKCSDTEALLEKEKKELKDLKQKCSGIESMLEKEKAKVLAATRAPPLTFSDVV